MTKDELGKLAEIVCGLSENEQLQVVAWVVKLLPSERVREFVDTCIILKDNYSDEEIVKMASDG